MYATNTESLFILQNIVISNMNGINSIYAAQVSLMIQNTRINNIINPKS